MAESLDSGRGRLWAPAERRLARRISTGVPGLTGLLVGLFHAVLPAETAWGQASLASSSGFLITFDTTLSGVNNGAYTGSGLHHTPSTGQLDSDAWRVTGMNDGDTAFGGVHGAPSDFARGSSSPATTGGLYGFDVDPSVTTDRAFGFQPGGDDVTPGTFVLRIQNNTGSTINRFRISFDIHVLNDQGRSNSLNAAYSTDGLAFTSLGVNYSSPGAADSTTFVLAATKTAEVSSGFSVADSAFFYILWATDDVSGSGSRDELAFDDISISVPEPSAGAVLVVGAVGSLRRRRH